MRKVSTHAKIEAENFIARLQKGKQHCGICLCAGMRLYIGVFAIKNLFEPVDGELFAFIYTSQPP